MTDVVGAHVEIVEGASGPKARIAGSRMQDVAIWYEKMGMSADEIVQEYPTITHAGVFAALAYYWDHREEIERQIAEGDAFAEEMRRRTPSRLAEKLKSLRADE